MVIKIITYCLLKVDDARIHMPPLRSVAYYIMGMADRTE